jgi:hypothetical protein
MELADIEFLAERSPGALAPFEEGQLSDHVA